MQMDIPLEEFQRIILEDNLETRHKIIMEIVEKYQVMYVKVLGKLYEMLGKEEYQRIMNNERIDEEIKDIKQDIKEVRDNIQEIKEVVEEKKEENIAFVDAYSYHKELRFCKVRYKEKKPFESDWVNKPYTWDEIQEHRAKSTNFGVLCGYGGLVVVDCDNKQFAEEIANEIPKTFTVRTGGGGIHYYFFCPELADKKIILKVEKEHFGEMQAKGTQVVAASSQHPSGNKYEVINQLPIYRIAKEQLLEVLKPYMQEVHEEEKKAIEYNKEFLGDDIGSIPITNVISTAGFRKLHSGEMQGINPWHGSSGGINFNINLSKNIAYCWRCSAGISVVQAIALSEGYIQNCTDEVRGETFLKVKEVAKRKYGYNEEKIVQKYVACTDVTDDIETVSNSILQLVLLKKKDEATEVAADYIKKTNNIYSTIDDKESEIWFYDEGIYKPNGKTKIEETCRRLFKVAYTPARASLVVDKVRMDTLIEKEMFFRNENIWEVPLLNGIFHILKKELSPWTPKKIFFNKLPIHYDPEAKCPAIDKHLKDVLAHESDTNVMYEIIGFLLCKDYFIEKAIMMVGLGRNGKGKTIDLIKRFLGLDNCASIPLTALVEDSFRVSELFGKMANLAGDLSSTALKDTSLFKMTTGRDLIGAKRKFLSDIKFMNFAKHIFACNELPRVYDFSEGFWNRWVLLEFPYKFIPEKEFNTCSVKERTEKKLKLMDPAHIDKISKQEELNGLFNAALEGLERVRRQKDFSYSRGSAEIKVFWMRKADSFLAFCYDHIEADKSATLEKSDLRRVFFEYCRRHSLKGVSDINMKIVLEEMFGATDVRRRNGDDITHYWLGIKLKNIPSNTLQV